MLATANFRRVVLLLAVAAATFGLSSCRQTQPDGLAIPNDLFGDGLPDESAVVCSFDGHEITQRDMDLRLAEMPQNFKQLFQGDGAERRLLEFMISELLQADAAVAEGLQADPTVHRQMLSQLRTTLRDAYAELVIWRNLEPTDEEIQQYYEEKKDSFRTEGQVKARHIQCSTREAAEAAYAKIREGGYDGLFANVAGVFSENKATAGTQGDLGWFSRKGFLPMLDDGPAFAAAVFDLDRGLHEPIKIGNAWHVVEILNREPSRQLTLDEVRDRIVREMQPTVQERARADWIEARRAETDIQYFGDFRPGQGRTAEELLRLGMLAGSFERSEQIYNLLLLDYPESEYAPMALFMLANLYLDTYGDSYNARRYLNQILRKYPDAEVRDQAEYMLENMGHQNFRTPKSIEEFRELND